MSTDTRQQIETALRAFSGPDPRAAAAIIKIGVAT